MPLKGYWQEMAHHVAHLIFLAEIHIIKADYFHWIIYTIDISKC